MSDEFVDKNEDRPYFRRHLRMSYDSFCVLLEQLTEHLDTAKNAIGNYKGHDILLEL